MSDTLRRAVADASCIIVRQEDQIQRALQVLQAAERYDLRPMKNYMGDGMRRDDTRGEWTEAKVLDTVLAILQEGQQ